MVKELFPNKPWTDKRYKICTVDKGNTCYLPEPCINPCQVVLDMENAQEMENNGNERLELGRERDGGTD